MEHARRYYQLDPGSYIAAQARYAKRNPEKRREIERRRDRVEWRSAYRAANLAKEQARFAKWREANLDKRRATEAKRRALTANAGGSYTDTDVADLLKAQHGKCGYCASPLKRRFHVDHIIPLAGGGQNIRSNLQLLCPSCNSRKGKKHPLDFAKVLGLLV